MTAETDFADMKNQTIESRQGHSGLKQYFCPHCQIPLIRGNIKRLKMTCPHCQKMIDSVEKDLLKR